ncbi:MAG: LysR family transcriptional regulator [Clostridia bacterium]|nr:LysR family transcriptional regulator [Clostridia bacterium]
MERPPLKCSVMLRIYGKDKCFGPGVAELLERIDTTHSLRKATMEMNMAYSKAWRVLKVAEENLGFPLLHSVTGGRGGGGASLTEEGRRFLSSYRLLERAVSDYADEAFLEFIG